MMAPTGEAEPDDARNSTASSPCSTGCGREGETRNQTLKLADSSPQVGEERARDRTTGAQTVDKEGGPNPRVAERIPSRRLKAGSIFKASRWPAPAQLRAPVSEAAVPG